MHRQRQQIFRTKRIKNQRHPLLHGRLGLEQWLSMALLQKVYNIATVLDNLAIVRFEHGYNKVTDRRQYPAGKLGIGRIPLAKRQALFDEIGSRLARIERMG